MKTNDTIKVHLYDLSNREIRTRNYDKTFCVYEKNGKLAGFDISANLEKMYQKYGKEEFQKAAQTSGYGFIFE